MKASSEIVHFAPYYSPFCIAIFVARPLAVKYHPAQCLVDEHEQATKPAQPGHQKKLGFVRTRYST
jgi:hypothetical protein